MVETTKPPLHRIKVGTKAGRTDPRVERLKKAIRNYLSIAVDEIKISRVFAIRKLLTKDELISLANGPLSDPVLEESFLEEEIDPAFDWTVEVGFKPGLTDNLANTAKITVQDYLGGNFQYGEEIRSLTQYQFKGEITHWEIDEIANGLLANPLVEEVKIVKHHNAEVEAVPLNGDDHHLMAVSQDRSLALSLNEMQAIRSYFLNPDVAEERNKIGLPANPTDVELEAIAQTWSEHCKHKIFNAKISYKCGEEVQEIDSLFKTCIKGATKKLSEKKSWLVSVFDDNAGIIRFNATSNLAAKVETHNSPSALDPYGGALTGILGVNRDIMGAGLGARLIANTDVLCFAPPDYQKPLPPKILHPRRILEGVRLGIEHGGNKSGVPTVNGSIVFDERYLGKPLVFCGSLGIMPPEIAGRPTHTKEILPGDCIVVAGGRTGKDGIHGATFSSEELHENSPTGAVQIGDPFTQKKLHDFLLDARDKGLYRALTDNGAGGFSSSVGEMALLSRGCELHLDKAPLKYDGMLPWEILVSESQERMTLAVPEKDFAALERLAALHEIEVARIGTFTASGYFHILFNGKTAGCLSLEFLHHGVPQLILEAEWIPPVETPLKTSEHFHPVEPHDLLSRLNVCSKENIIRQYDHEVQGGTVLKPLQGACEDGPGNASIVLPTENEESMEGIVVANGICPRFSDIDTYHMAANAIDEAIRNAVCVGCDPERIALLDNFCWPDPIYDPEKTPDGKFKLAQLVRANQALYDYALAFETPIISGKDSMKNDYKAGQIKISVPPTLLITAIGKIADVTKAVSMDVKCAGDWVYVIGTTKNELGGSEYAAMKKLSGGVVPKVNAQAAKDLYARLHEAMRQELVASCHDCSEGGLAVAFMETAMAGDLGLQLDLHTVPADGVHTDAELLFSESASRFVVTIDPKKAKEFEAILGPVPYGRVGVVTEHKLVEAIGIHGETILSDELSTLKKYWQNRI